MGKSWKSTTWENGAIENILTERERSKREQKSRMRSRGDSEKAKSQSCLPVSGKMKNRDKPTWPENNKQRQTWNLLNLASWAWSGKKRRTWCDLAGEIKDYKPCTADSLQRVLLPWFWKSSCSSGNRNICSSICEKHRTVCFRDKFRVRRLPDWSRRSLPVEWLSIWAYMISSFWSLAIWNEHLSPAGKGDDLYWVCYKDDAFDCTAE